MGFLMIMESYMIILKFCIIQGLTLGISQDKSPPNMSLSNINCNLDFLTDHK